MRLDEWVRPFALPSANLEPALGTIATSTVLVEPVGGRSMALRFRIRRGNATRAQAITPTVPELGYPIDNDDYSVAARHAKWQRIREELTGRLDRRGFAWYLQVESRFDELKEHGWLRGFYPMPVIAPSDRALLEGLRLQVRFGDGDYEARPDPEYFGSGSIVFTAFYPADRGPLATQNRTSVVSWMADGLPIYLPEQWDELRAIQARVISGVQPQPRPSASRAERSATADLSRENARLREQIRDLERRLQAATIFRQPASRPNRDDPQGYYHQLGLAPESSRLPAEQFDRLLQSAYRVHAQVAHPDRGGDDATMKAVNEAYQFLKDAAKRRSYGA